MSLSNSTSSNEVVICTRIDGLGSRIHTLMNAYAYASRAEADLYLEWPQLPRKLYLSASNQELRDYRSIFASNNAFTGFRCPILDPAEADLLRTSNNVINADYAKYFKLEDEVIREKYSEAWQLLAFNDNTVASVDEAFAGLSQSGELIAIHMRRGDIIDEMIECSIQRLEIRIDTLLRRFVPLSCVKRFCRSLVRQDKRFVIFTNDTSVKDDSFLGEYLVPPMASSQVNQSLAELLLMSRAMIIYCPLTSNYSKCSSLGGQVPREYLPIKRKDVLEELLSLLEARSDNSDTAQKMKIISATAARFWK